MKYEYRPQGVCPRVLYLDVEDGIINEVEFVGGCNGNLQGLAALVKGMKAEDVIEKVQGIRCGFKKTSCPDQLSCALKEITGK